MTTLHFVKKARKDNPVVKKGESYYWWKFPFGTKTFSKERPQRSRLTQSSYLSTLWDIQDNFGLNIEAIEDSIDSLVQQLNDLRDECQDSLDNMPEHLQDTSDAGNTLTERIDALDDCISNLESIDLEAYAEDNLEEEVRQEQYENLEDEVQQYINEL